MKILQLCRKFPYPLKDGESIAVTYIAKAYRDLGADLTLLSFNTIKHYCEIDQLPATFNHYQSIHTVYLNNYPEPFGAFINLFSQESYHISRFTTQAFKAELAKVLEQQAFDIIQLESVYFAPYLPLIRSLTNAKIVMRAHNVEFEIWERVAENTTFLPKKWYLELLVKKLKRYEIAQLKSYDLLLAMTEKDLNYFRSLGYEKASIIVPVGLPLVEYSPVFEINNPSISFIGSLDWVPNQEGLTWFIAEVWDHLKEKIPALEFHIAGRNTPDWIFKKAGNGIIVHGEVEDSKQFLLQHPITIVPLFSGSGMRVKILEGMALGRVVLTTTLGVEGIEAQDGKEILIADTKNQFIEKIKEAFKYPTQTIALMKKARSFIENHFDNKAIAKKVLIKMEEVFKV